MQGKQGHTVDDDKNSLNLKNSKPLSLYNNVPSIMECLHDQQDPSGMKIITNVQKTAKLPKLVFFLLSSDRIVENCVTVTSFCTKQHFTLTSAQPHRLSQHEGFTRHLKPPTQELWLHLLTPFFIC